MSWKWITPTFIVAVLTVVTWFAAKAPEPAAIWIVSAVDGVVFIGGLIYYLKYRNQ